MVEILLEGNKKKCVLVNYWAFPSILNCNTQSISSSLCPIAFIDHVTIEVFKDQCDILSQVPILPILPVNSNYDQSESGFLWLSHWPETKCLAQLLTAADCLRLLSSLVITNGFVLPKVWYWWISVRIQLIASVFQSNSHFLYLNL